MKPISKNPLSLTKHLDQFLQLSYYTWVAVMPLMNILSAREKNGMIGREAMKIWEREDIAGLGISSAKDNIPKIINVIIPQSKIVRRKGGNDEKNFKKSTLRSQNASKTFEVQHQKKEKNPSAFLQRLRDQIRKYAGLSPESQLRQCFLN